jgi:hypothetical protein
MLKRLLTIIALAVVQIALIPAAHAGGNVHIFGGGPTGSGWPSNVGGGLPAHNGGGGDVKSKPTGTAGLTPQLLLPGHIPPKIHGPFPGPYPGRDPRTL